MGIAKVPAIVAKLPTRLSQSSSFFCSSLGSFNITILHLLGPLQIRWGLLPLGFLTTSYVSSPTPPLVATLAISADWVAPILDSSNPLIPPPPMVAP